MAVDLSVLATFLVSTGALVSAVAAFSQSRTARKQSDAADQSTANKVTIEAFDTAKGLWETSVKDSRAYIDQLRLELVETKKELKNARVELEEAGSILSQEKTQRQFLQIQVDQLQLTVRKLEMKLRQLGVTVETDEELGN